MSDAAAGAIEPGSGEALSKILDGRMEDGGVSRADAGAVKQDSGASVNSGAVNDSNEAAAGDGGVAQSPADGSTGDGKKVGWKESGAVGGADEEVPGATAEDLIDIPVEVEQDKNVRKAFIKERIRARKMLEAERDRRAAPVDDAKPKPDSAKVSGGIETLEDHERVFDYLARAQGAIDGRDEEWDEGKGRRILTLAKEALASVTDTTAALEVLRRAEAGLYGERSEQIAEAVRKELAPIEARRGIARERAEEEKRRVSELQGEIKTAIVDVLKKYPELKRDEAGSESEELLFCREWMKSNVGVPEKPGRRFYEMQSPDGVRAVIDDAMAHFQAKRVAQLEGTIAALRTRLGEVESPIAGVGSPAGSSEKGPKPGSGEALASILGKYA